MTSYAFPPEPDDDTCEPDEPSPRENRNLTILAGVTALGVVLVCAGQILKLMGVW